MKKWFLISAMVLVGALAMPGTAAAQIGDGRDGGCDASWYVCDDGVFGDPSGWAGGSYGAGAFSKCRDSFGCLRCVTNEEKTTPLCVRIYMMYGWCKCSPIRMETRYGGPYAVCSLEDSCDIR